MLCLSIFVSFGSASDPIRIRLSYEMSVRIMSSERSETMIDIRVGCYFVPLQSNERSDYTRKMFMHVPLNERRLKCLPQKLRYVIHRLII